MSKVEYASEIKFLSGKCIWGGIMRVNLLTFTPGRQSAGFHVLDSMWMMSRACAVAFNLPWPLMVRSSSSHSSSMHKVPNGKCPLQVETFCLKCLITSRGTNLELKMTNLDLETQNMIYTISLPDHYKILTYTNLFAEDLAKEAQYQEATEKSMQLETKVSIDPFL